MAERQNKIKKTSKHGKPLGRPEDTPEQWAAKVERYFKKAKEEAEKNNIFFIDDLIPFLGISAKSFYNYFPVGSDKHTEIKECVQNVAIRLKVKINNNLYINTDNMTAQLSLLKQVSKEAQQALSMQRIEATGKDGAPLIPKIEVIIKR